MRQGCEQDYEREVQAAQVEVGQVEQAGVEQDREQWLEYLQ